MVTRNQQRQEPEQPPPEQESEAIAAHQQPEQELSLPHQHNPDIIASGNILLKLPEYFGSESPQQFIQMFISFCALSGVQDAQKAWPLV